MAIPRGRCDNYDYCVIATKRTVVDAQSAERFNCPECGSRLVAVVEHTAAPAGRGAMAAGFIVALLAVAALDARQLLTARSQAISSPSAPAVVATQHAVQPAPRPAPPPDVLAPVAAAPVPETVLFRMQGSNTIGEVLAPKLAQAFLTASGDTHVAIRRLTQADEMEVVGTRGGLLEAIKISAHGSSTAFSSMGADGADIGMASRRIKPGEQAGLTATQGDLTAPAAEHVLALDGIAVIVHQTNPTGELSTAQLAGIFRGTITNWSQLGGPVAPIHLFARDDRSGTFDTFRSLVLDNAQLAQGTRRIEDSAELAADVAGDPAAIGFVGLPYVADAKTVAVSESGATPLVPNRLTVATEDYPLTRRLFLYTPTLHPNALAQRFVAFALSPPGQAVVDEVGFVPLTIETAAAEVPRGAPAKFRALAEAARRLSTAFRFRPNSADLDNRGLHDLDRLVDFMAMQHMHGDQLTLVGFADGLGTATSNMAVARRRAEAVAAQMAQRGLQVGNTMALGAALPVANNATEEGREKNRRVEVFLVGLGQRTNL